MSTEKKKILIVDDSAMDRNLLAGVLKKKGYETITLDSGERCMEFVETNKPDAVLLDILMPNVQGKQVVHILRQKFSSIELPIIMVTVKAEPEDIIEALQLGANDYITKPVDFDIALMRIQTHLKIVELSKHMLRLKELEAINGMVATYNHEINNPLAIALGAAKSLEKTTDEIAIKKLMDALWRVADIVKRIEAATMQYSVEYEEYGGQATKMVKLK